MENPSRDARPVPPQNGGPPAGERRGGFLGWFGRGGWYIFVPVLSLGILSFVPFVHAAARTRRPLMWLTAVLYTAAVVTLFLVPREVNIGGYAVGLAIIATVHSVVLRQRVWNGASAVRPTAPPATDPAVAAVLAARARRDEARRIVSRDPAMARELGIGRPDLRRAYDDGGLVDLNNAPARAIAGTCGIDLVHAEAITAARANGIHFVTVDDVFSVTDIPFPLWERIRDRAVVVTG